LPRVTSVASSAPLRNIQLRRQNWSHHATWASNAFLSFIDACVPEHAQRAILSEFPRLAFKQCFKASLCDVVRRKPATSFDNILRDFGSRYVDGFKTPSFADLFEAAPFSE
jgi:hypothetical protein